MTDNPPTAEEQSCCACLNVKYDPLPVGGNMMLERWVCELCGTPFVRFEKLKAAEQAVRKQALKEAANIAEAGTLAYPKRYNWAKQNYTGGWNQSRHNLARELRALAEKEQK